MTSLSACFYAIQGFSVVFIELVHLLGLEHTLRAASYRFLFFLTAIPTPLVDFGAVQP